MKKRLLPITLLVALGLVACTPTTSSSTPSSSSSEETSSSEVSSQPAEVTTLAISNKEALTAEWHVGDANRAIELDTDQPININAEIAEGTLVVTSSDSTVVLVNGKYLSAVGVGTATITVTYKETLTDTVELTIEETLKEPDYKAATPASLLTQEDNAGKFAYFVDGKVQSWAPATDANPDLYGDMYLEDLTDSSKAFYLYGTTANAEALSYSLANKAYSFSNPKTFLTNEYTSKIAKGDTLNTITIRKDHKDTVEGMSIIRGINGTIIPNYVQSTDEVFAAEFQTNYAVEVTGTVTGFYNSDDGGEYGNVIIKTEGSTNELVVYGLTAQTSCLKIDAEKGNLYMSNPKDWLTNSATNGIKVGDTITVIGIRADYKGTPQIKGYLKPTAEPSVALDTTKAAIAIGATVQLKAELVNVTGAVTWTSSDTTKATVSDTGLVTGVAAGKATITAKVGELEATCAVTVYDPIPEPTEHNTTKTLAEMLEPAEVKYSTEIVELQVKISGYKAGETAWEQYGNMVVTDLDGQNEVAVYGSTATKTAMQWSEQYGNYSFKNPKDFTSNPKTAALQIGDVIDVWAIRSDYVKDGNVTKQLNLVIIFPEAAPEVALSEATQPEGITWGNWNNKEATQVITLDPANKENEVIAFKTYEGAGFSSMYVLMSNIVAGDTYEISFKFNAPEGCDNVGMAFYNVTDGNRVPEVNVFNNAELTAAGAEIVELEDGWKQVSWTRTFEAGKKFDSAHIWCNVGFGTVYFDDFTATSEEDNSELFIGGDFTGWMEKAPAEVGEIAAYDFTTLSATPNSSNGYGALDAAGLLEAFKSCAKDTNVVKAVTSATKVYSGNDNGDTGKGAFSTNGCLKFSSSKEAGTFALTLEDGVEAVGVRVKAFAWNEKETGAKIAVNGVTHDTPISYDGTTPVAEFVEFTFDASNTLSFQFTKRAFVFEIEILLA